MQLSINHDEILDDPTAEQIRAAISGLEDGDFAVLTRDDGWFLQTLFDAEDGLIFETSEGSVEQHFFAVEPPLTRELVIDAFIAYNGGSYDWKPNFQWELLELVEADFTVIATADSAGVEEGEIDWEDAVELPGLGIPQLVSLYRLLCGGDQETLHKEFVVVAETAVEGVDLIRLLPLPGALELALQRVGQEADDEDVMEIAGLWRATEDFPDDFDEQDVREIIASIAQLSRRAAMQSAMLVACSLE